MKKEIAVMMAAMMVAGNVSAVFAASFTDINDVPWEGAKTYINNVADLNLMVGDTNTKGQKVFRARDQVTYCETMQLAYQLLKNSNNLKDTASLSKKWSGVLTGYHIPVWAQEAVSYGLEYNILSLSDVSKFMKNSTTNNNATREGVAVIFGKTLASMNTIDTGAVLYFNDKSSIANTSVPYVDLLVRLNILVGDDNNNFNAKNYINRAEMAVVVSKTNGTLKTGSNSGTNENPINPSTPDVNAAASAKGTIIKVDTNTKMITVLSDNKNLGFFGTDSTPVTKEGSTDSLKFSDLNVGDIITVNYVGSTVNSIIVSYQTPTIAASTVKGYIDEIFNDRIYINKTSGGEANYALAVNVKITMDGRDATMKQLFDANDEGVIEVELSLDNTGKVTKIVALESDSGAIYGKIVDLDSDEIEIKKTNGKTETYDLGAGIVVRLENKDSSIRRVQDAMDDDTIYCKVFLDSRDRVTKLFASEDKYDNTDSDGTIRSISSSRISIKRSGGSTKEYVMADDVTYRLDGSSSKLSEIRNAVDDEDAVYVKLSFNNKDEVTKVDATVDDDDDDDEDTIKGEVTRLTSDYIKIKKSNGKTEEIDLTDDTTYRFEGSKISLKNLKEEVEDDDVYAIVTVDSRNRAEKVEASNDEDDLDDDDDIVKGELISLSRSDVEIRKSSGSSKKTYDLADDVTYRLDGSKSDYSEMKDAIREDTVDAKLTLNSKDKVTKIDAETDGGSSTKTVRGTMKRLYDDSLILRTDNGSEKEYDFASRITYYLDGSESRYSAISNALDKYSNMDTRLTLNSSGDITKLEVYTNNTDKTNKTVKGDVVFITDNSIKVDGDDGAEVYVFDSKVGIYLSGSSATVKEINDKMTEKYKVVATVTISDGKVTKIDALYY